MNKANFMASLLCFAPLFSGVVVAQDGLTIDRISLIGGNQVEIIVTDDGSGSTAYDLESTATLGAGTWTRSTPSFTELGNEVTITAPRPAGDGYFFRVLGVAGGTAEDPDGDGPTSTFETTGWRPTTGGPPYTSDPAKFDTDGDGFSDGTEVACGTNPRDAGSKPHQSMLPSIEFAGEISPSIVTLSPESTRNR